MKKKIIPGFIVVLVSYLLFTQIAIETGDPKQSPNLIETGWLQAQQLRTSSPNIILIMTDDLGWTSVSYRSDPERADSKSDYIETPHMARAAEAGMRFTDAYATNPICSPTRHSILFGQNAARHIYAKNLDWMKDAPNWLTLPKAVKQADLAYRTAHFGKWHVGLMPQRAGFDFSDGPTANSHGDLQNGKYKETRLVRNKLKEYNTEHSITPPALNNSYSKQPVFYIDEDPKAAVGMTARAEAFMRESQAAGMHGPQK